MGKEKLIQVQAAAFENYLRLEKRSCGTIENYVRHVQEFLSWAGDREVCKELSVAWKERLLSKGYKLSTINGMLISLNRFFHFLRKEEYDRLISTTEQAGKECLALLMESICATGIRVSEVQYLTVEAARDRRTGISLKGKVRTILLPGKLCRKLLKYARRKNQPRKHPFDLGSIFACHFLKSRFWGLFFKYPCAILKQHNYAKE